MKSWRMRLKMFGIIDAEGNPEELALFASLVLCVLKDKTEADQQKTVHDWMEKYGDKTFEELLRMEREDEE